MEGVKVHGHICGEGIEAGSHLPRQWQSPHFQQTNHYELPPSSQGKAAVQPSKQGKAAVQPGKQGKAAVQPSKQGKAAVQPSSFPIGLDWNFGIKLPLLA